MPTRRAGGGGPVPLLLAAGTVCLAFSPLNAAAMPLMALSGLWAIWRVPQLVEGRSDSVETLVLVWLGLWSISMALAVDPRHAVALSMPTVAFGLLFVLMRRYPGDDTWTAVLAALFGVATVQFCHVGIALLLSGSPRLDLLRPWILVPNDLSWVLCLWPLWWARFGINGRSRVLLGFLLALQGGVAIQAGSRLFLLLAAALLGAEIYQTFQSRRTRFWMLLALVATVGSALVATTIDKGTDTVLARLQLWDAGIALWQQAPWLGHGPHHFGQLYTPYMDAAQMDWRQMPWPHSVPVELLVNTGILGLISMLGVFFAAFGSIGRRQRSARDWPLLASVVTFLAIAMVESSPLRIWWWVVLGLLLGAIPFLKPSIQVTKPARKPDSP